MRLGDVIEGYTLNGFCDDGSTATVYRAEKVGQVVAVKVLKKDVTGDREAQKTFSNEVKILTRLDHPGIVRIFGHGIYHDEQKREFPYIIMEYAPKKNLSTTYPAKNQPWPPGRVLLYTKQIAEALDHAHKAEIIHCDLKPSNIFLSESDSIKVGDFGYARVWHSTQQKSSSTPRGFTYYYAAPEQFNEKKFGRVSFATDQYALAMIIYSWLSGKSPFPDSDEESPNTRLMHDHMKTPPTPLRKYPPQVSQCLIKALAKYPKERYASVLDFAKTLEAALTASNVVAVPFSSAANTDVLKKSGEDEKRRGIALREAKRPEEALKAFDQAIAINSADGAAYREQGIVYRELRRPEEALKAFDQAIAINRADGAAYREQGITYTLSEQYEQALTALDKAVELNAQDSDGYQWRGYIMAWRKGNYKKGETDFTRAIELNRDNALAYTGRGLCWVEQKDVEQAKQDWHKALELKPFCVHTAWTLWWLDAGLDDPHKAGMHLHHTISRLDLRIKDEREKTFLHQICESVDLGLQGNVPAGHERLAQANPGYLGQWHRTFWQGMLDAWANGNGAHSAFALFEQALREGMPPLFLRPLIWLKGSHQTLFEQRLRPLLDFIGYL